MTMFKDRCECVGAPFALRHVGVIWLVFHVLNFYQLILHNKISESTMKYLQEPDWKSDLR